MPMNTSDTLALWAVRETDTQLSPSERAEIATRLRDVLNAYYVHLPQKTTSMAISPLQELDLLTNDADSFLSNHLFFSRLSRIFAKLRDRHTNLRLPAPWNKMIAYLPLVLESCYEDGRRKLIVSKFIETPPDSDFQLGVEITHWNGCPVQTLIENLSWQTNGSNPFARIALALRSLTLRPLAFAMPPDEDWVTLSYIDATGAQKTTSFLWKVVLTPERPSSDTTTTEGGAPLLGLDEGTELTNLGLKKLFSQHKQEQKTTLGLSNANPALRQENITSGAADDAIEGRVQASKITTAAGEHYGYLRIFSFSTNDVRKFTQSMSAVLKQMPENGLIIDVRANPGGTIPAGEALLHLLTDKPVEDTRNVFRATNETRKLSNGVPFFSRWQRSLEIVYETGQPYSQGYPLGLPSHYEGLEGSYTGPVVVIMDSLSYSTTDYFVAGFQDNKIGRILGLDPTTGAGGANVWSLGQINQFALQAGMDGIPPLPNGVEANIAVRRALRVGDNSGLPLEGLGAIPDALHYTTRRDLISKNEDLLLRAIKEVNRLSATPEAER